MATQSSLAEARADMADAHYKRALQYYQNKDYPKAIREFQAAYKVRQLPRILLNIGQIYRKLGMASAALKFYKHYLRVEPNPKPEIKAEVQGYIEQTQAMLDPPEIVEPPPTSASAAAAAAVAAAPSDVTPISGAEPYELPLVISDTKKGRAAEPPPAKGTAPAPEPDKSGAADGGQARALPPDLRAPAWGTAPGSAPPDLTSVGKPPPARKPFYKKAWFWGVVGTVVAAAVITGVGMGVGVQKDSLPPTILHPQPP